MERIVVVGAGLAGVHSARALRTRGYAGQLTLVGAEPYPPYDRPPLSKELLAGEIEDTTLETDWSTLDTELLTSRRATGLRPGAVDTDAGRLDFDALIVATGASPLRLPGQGSQRTLRTVDDARSLRAALRPGVRLAIVGAGWIGAEVATTAARAGCRVTVVEAGPTPLAANVGADIGRHTMRWYADAGIELRLDTAVEEVVDGGLLLAGGEFLPADEVLTAVGVRPEAGWLSGSPVELDPTDGAVVVDEWSRTSVPGVCAVGDCAAWWSPRFGARLRVEHWDNALRAPAVAAATLLDDLEDGPGVEDARPHDPVPYFWSAQHGRMLQYAGYHPVADEVLWRGDPAGDRWTVCWLRRGELVAVLTVDRPRDLVQARRLLASADGHALGEGAAGGIQMDAKLLADPETPLKQAAIRH